MFEVTAAILLVFYLFLLIQWRYVKRQNWFDRGAVGLLVMIAFQWLGGMVGDLRFLSRVSPLLLIWTLACALLACYQGPTLADRVAGDMNKVLEPGKKKDAEEAEEKE